MTAAAAYLEGIISGLIEECYNETDIDRKTQLLYKINSVLPKLSQENIPSLITDDYIDTALYRIHQRYTQYITIIKGCKNDFIVLYSLDAAENNVNTFKDINGPPLMILANPISDSIVQI